MTGQAVPDGGHPPRPAGVTECPVGIVSVASVRQCGRCPRVALNACVSLSETVSQRQAMSRLGFFFLPGAPPGRVLATCQEWRSEEKLVSRESKILSRVAATCHRTENGSFAAGRKVSFPGRVEAAARSGGGGCSVWRANNTRMPIGARLSRAERSRPCARVPRLFFFFGYSKPQVRRFGELVLIAQDTP